MVEASEADATNTVDISKPHFQGQSLSVLCARPRAEQPVFPVKLADGRTAWLITRNGVARQPGPTPGRILATFTTTVPRYLAWRPQPHCASFAMIRRSGSSSNDVLTPHALIRSRHNSSARVSFSSASSFVTFRGSLSDEGDWKGLEVQFP